MTLAVDTDKRRGTRDGEFGGEIDPNAYYTLYGDRTYQEFEGVSRYPVFVKLEKRQAYALFGDFDTNVTEGRLTSYNRKLTGLKAEYIGDDLQVGPYQLSNDRVIPQSEEIVVETRDRVRPDVILERKTLVRFLDYTLDYFSGELIFRLPVDATDAQIGSSFTHENGSALTAGAKSNQIGIDVIAKLSDTTEVRAEYAVTDHSNDGEGVADAKLLEVVHTSEKLLAEAYFREEESGFGLGQSASNTNGVRRYGARGAINVQEITDEETGRRSIRKLEGQAYREENLSTGNSRTSVEVLASQDGTKLDASGGLRFTQDRFVNDESRASLLAVARASYDISKHGITVQASAETPIGGNDEVSAQPQRLALGIDKRIGNVAIVNLRHERLNGGGQTSDNTTIGVTATPWTGGTATVAADNLTNDGSRRLGATVGLDQTVRLSERVSGQVGVRARRLLEAEDDFVEIAPDAAISPVEVNEDFQSVYVGAAYRDEKMNISGRVEVRENDDDQTWVLSSSAARELSDKFSLAASARGHISDATGAGGTSEYYEARIGAAWRPRNEDTVVFNRFDIINSQPLNDINTTKLVTGTSYSWGPSVGVSPVDNVWISAGYNVQGFKDDDFEAAEYARKGAYLQLRVKFDQNTASGLLRRISPVADTIGPVEERKVLSAP